MRWSIYREWYHTNGHSVSRPTLAKVADFLYWLRYARGLSVSSLHGYRSVLSAVFRFHLPSLSSDPVIRDLLRSFRLSSAERVLRPPAWDLCTVLTYFVSPAFEPLSQASFRALTLTTSFLLALATAKRVGELQILSSIVTFVAGVACLSYIPQFVAKSESLTCSIPRFLVPSLADFAAGLNTDLLLCPIGPSACMCFGPGLCLQVAIAFSCPLGALLALCLRTQCRSFWGRSFLPLRPLDLRLDPSGLMTSAVCPRLSLSTVTGRLPLS